MTSPTHPTTTTTTTTKRGTHTPRNKRQLNVYITAETSALLTAILERDGVPYSAQVDRAIRAWAEQKGISIEGSHASKRGTR